MNDDSTPPVACSLGAAAFAERRARIRQALARWLRQAEPVEDGFALRFERTDAVVAELAQLVALESACCPFLGLTLSVEPAGGAVRLRVTGVAGLPDWVAAALGSNGV